MDLPSPLYSGKLIKRYKRFLADVELETGEIITAHCANPGAMTGLKDPGMAVWLSRSDDPKRKLAYSLELVEADGGLVGIHTGKPNAIIEEAIKASQIPELTGYETLRREVKYGQNSRIDILLEDPARGLCYVEIKNVHLKRQDGPNPGFAEFPDSVTSRGAKHLLELADMVREGHRAVMMFCVQRMDCQHFTTAGDIDPVYARTLKEAAANGVELLCWDCEITNAAITLRRPLEIRL